MHLFLIYGTFGAASLQIQRLLERIRRHLQRIGKLLQKTGRFSWNNLWRCHWRVQCLHNCHTHTFHLPVIQLRRKIHLSSCILELLHLFLPLHHQILLPPAVGKRKKYKLWLCRLTLTGLVYNSYIFIFFANCVFLIGFLAMQLRM